MSVNSGIRQLRPRAACGAGANVKAAIAEDVGAGDLTGLLVPADKPVHARVIVREARCCAVARGSRLHAAIDDGCR
jgi:nicotinate-nucleotide pyrophosphorylase (carboxylating)